VEPGAVLTLLTLFATAEGGNSALTAVGMLVGAQVIAGVLIWVFFIAKVGGDDDPGSDDDGPGWGRRPPTPPEPPVSWPDFERQFAEHVQALGDRGAVKAR